MINRQWILRVLLAIFCRATRLYLSLRKMDETLIVILCKNKHKEKKRKKKKRLKVVVEDVGKTMDRATRTINLRRDPLLRYRTIFLRMSGIVGRDPAVAFVGKVTFVLETDGAAVEDV